MRSKYLWRKKTQVPFYTYYTKLDTCIYKMLTLISYVMTQRITRLFTSNTTTTGIPINFSRASPRAELLTCNHSTSWNSAKASKNLVNFCICERTHGLRQARGCWQHSPVFALLGPMCTAVGQGHRLHTASGENHCTGTTCRYLKEEQK